MNTTISPIAIPTPGTPAYWAAQREAVALVAAYKVAASDACWVWIELDSLRQVAAHGFAVRMFAAQGNDLPGMIHRLQQIVHEVGEDDEAAEEEDADSPGAPPPGADWCLRGCQPMFGMECGMCGYSGPGVWASQFATVAEYCCHCNARTYQSPDGICTLHGRDAETPDEAAPQAALCFGECGTVTTDTQCALCRDLEHHARSAVDDAAREPQATPGLATAAALARAALACSGAPRIDDRGKGQP